MTNQNVKAGPNTRTDGVLQHITEIDTLTDDAAKTLTFRVFLDGTFSAPDLERFDDSLLGTIEISVGLGVPGQTFKVAGLTDNFATDFYISLDSEDPFVGYHSDPNFVDLLTGDSTYVSSVPITYDFAANSFSVTVSYSDIGGSGDVRYAMFATTSDGMSADQFAGPGSVSLSSGPADANPVPAPPSAVLLASGVLCLAGFGWRWRSGLRIPRPQE